VSRLLVHLRAPAGSGTTLGSRRLLIFAGVLGVVGAALWTLPLHDSHQLTVGHSIPPWALVGVCYVCSILSVEVRVRRSNSSLSLTEIPVVVGLFLVDPHVLLLSYLLGVLAGNWTRRGVRPVLDASNLMLDLLTVAVTVLVFDSVGPDPHDALAPRSILALAAGMAATGMLVGPLAVNAGIRLYEGSMDLRSLLRSYVFEAGATLTNSCLGVITLALWLYRPLFEIALVPPVALVFAGQLAATDGQRRADRMEFLYRTNDLLHSPKPMVERYGDLLRACLTTFSSGRAELIMIPDSREPAVRLRVSGGGQTDPALMSSAPLTFGEQEMLNTLRERRVVSGLSTSCDTPLGLLLEERGARSGTVALLRGHGRVLGMILLLDTHVAGGGASTQDRTLLATLAGQMSVALENGQLADAMEAMAVENDELARKALHDPLTQLPNRSLFEDTVEEALANLPGAMRYIAVMFIDLDGFKEVNDEHGHAAGDRVLCSIAGRLREQVRKHDLAARLGGDEFAVLLNGLREPAEARMVAGRIVGSLLTPLELSGVEVRLGGSVGVAVVDDSPQATSANELLRRADSAMYMAKRQGKGRFAFFDTTSREPVLLDPSAPPPPRFAPETVSRSA